LISVLDLTAASDPSLDFSPPSFDHSTSVLHFRQSTRY